MTPEFRAGERVTFIDYPCCECGKDSDCYASFNEKDAEGNTEWLCESCCEKDASAAREGSAGQTDNMIALADGMFG